MKNKKAFAFAVTAIVLLSILGLALDCVAAASGKAQGLANKLIHRSWIRINGVIDQWGTTEVRGTLQAQGTNQSGGATAMWTASTSRPIQSVRAKENFTYSFYTATLVNGTVTTFNANSSGTNYVISGTWKLSTVTSSTTIITNAEDEIIRVIRDQEILPQKAYGELTITNNWRNFTLAINGIDPLTGSVYHSITRAWFNPFKITNETTTNTVTKFDIKEVGKCYGAMPGWGSYDTRMDFNNNYRIDIADISTVAANV